MLLPSERVYFKMKFALKYFKHFFVLKIFRNVSACVCGFDLYAVLMKKMNLYVLEVLWGVTPDIVINNKSIQFSLVILKLLLTEILFEKYFLVFS